MTSSQPNNSTSNLDAVAAWDKCLAIIKDNVNWRAFQTWFEPIKAAALANNVLTIQVPSQFFYEWLEEHYVELLGKTIKRILGREGRLEYRIQMEAAAQQRQQPATMQLPSRVPDAAGCPVGRMCHSTPAPGRHGNPGRRPGPAH